MREFKQLSSILWKRNRIWIIMIIALFLLGQSFTVNNEITGYNYWITEGLASLDVLSEMWDSKESYTSGDFYNTYYNKLQIQTREYTKKYKDGIPEDALSTFDHKFKALSDEVGYEIGKIEEYQNMRYNPKTDKNNLNTIDGLVIDELYQYDRNVNDKLFRADGFHKLNITKSIFNPGFGIFMVMLILGFLLTSLEHLTPYYEFTRMFPWSNTKTYFSKITLGGIIVLVTHLVSAGIRYGQWKNSIYKNIIGLNQIWSEGLILILVVLGIYFMFMSIGTVSGNILGNFGMLIIGFGGIQLINYNILGLSYVVLGDLSNDYWLYKFTNWINELPEYIRVILTPITIMDSYSYNPTNNMKVFAFFAVSLVFLALGWFWTNHNKSERSGMLIMRRDVSLYAQALAVITTANSIFMLFRNTVESRVISIPIFIIGFVLSYLFYKKLFNVRIGI